jgi:hypothetical protein
MRMNDDSTLKQTLNTKLDRVRRVGRPKMRWKDGIDQDTEILEVKNWKKVALDRDEWAKLVMKGRQGTPRGVEPMMMLMKGKKI